MELTKELLNELFDYKDGQLFWKATTNPKRVKNGSVAGSPGNGRRGLLYMNVKIFGKTYRNHRLIFLLHHGYLPKIVDHIDNDTLNNRIENLREATSSQNNSNVKLSSKNTSGVKGVSWHSRDKKWAVNLRCEGRQHSFGYFDDLELAELVATEARNIYHGEFARH